MSIPQIITFGVELEFCVAILHDGFEPKDFPPTTKQVEFPPIEGERQHHPSRYEFRVKKAIGDTIAAAKKYKIDLENLARQNVENWVVTIDTSIVGHPEPSYNLDAASTASTSSQDSEGSISQRSGNSQFSNPGDPEFDPWEYQGIEVRSPKLEFTPESLAEVESLCALLTSTYKIKNNTTTGLHVHLGHDTQGFTFPNIRKLLVFLYTFEPQIASLHPIHRMNNAYGRSMRDYSPFSLNFQAKYERRPTAAEFASKIFSLKTRGHAFRLAMGGKGYKQNNYNFGGIVKKAHTSGIIQAVEGRQTIEFRQHEGTMDGQRITHWIQVIVGFVKFVEEAPSESFFGLLTRIWAAEKWEKMGDGKDAEREDKLGPILADHGFTIINLLEHLGLHPQADYYKDKWQKHPSDHNRQEYIKSDVTWDFKQAGINPNTNEYQQALILTELFTTLRLVKKAAKQAGSSKENLAKIDLDAPGLWPGHSINLDLYSEEEPMSDEE
jgi:hypothetical protein